MTTGLTRTTSDELVALTDCPYRGLQPYREEDAEYYFGRDRDRDLVIANLMATRLTVLYGPSGVGKSSLLRAGVVRLLTRLPASSFSYLAVGNTVVAYQATWRSDPLSSLGDALRAAVRTEQDTGAYEPGPGPLSLEMVEEVSRSLDADVFLILDQFEEESLYCGPEATEALAVELGRIVGAQDVRASVLIGIREDSLATLDRLEAHVPGLFDNTLRLQHLDASAARQAIEQPLVRYNADRDPAEHVQIEAELVDELLVQLRTGRLSVADAGQGGEEDGVTIETPFLQLVMTRLWGEERAEGSAVLRLSTLRRLGDAERIVRTHLDHVMEQLTPGDRRMAATVFRYLVTPSGMKIAHTAEDLANYAGLDDPAALAPVLEELSSGRERILRPVEPPLDRPGALRYEIFHDVLAAAILDWRRRFVTDEERAESERRLFAEREEAVRAHEETRRRLRRTRLFSGALVLLLVVAVIAASWAVINENKAQTAVLLAESAELLQRDPTQALAKAVEADSLAASPATQTAVRSALEVDHERLRVTASTGYRNVIAFSPDGRTFFATGSSPTAVLHDVATGRQLRELTRAGGATDIWAGFSADNAMLAVSTDQGRTTVYDAESGEQLRSVEHPGGSMPRWASINGKPALLSSGEGGSVDVWQPGPAATEGVRMVGDPAAPGYSNGFEVSSDGSRLVTVQLDFSDDFTAISTFRVWDTGTGELLATSEPFSGDATSVAFLGTDATTVAISTQPTDDFFAPALWSWTTESTVTVGENRSRLPSVISGSDDGARLAFTQDKTVWVFAADDPAPQHALPEQPELLNVGRLSPDGTQVVTGGVGGQALVWRLGSNYEPSGPVQRLLGHNGEIADVRFSPTDPELVLTSGYDGTVRLWQLASAQVMTTTSTWMTGADVTRDGTRVVSLTDTGDISIVDVRSGTELTTSWVDEAGEVFARVKWLPDGRHVAVAATYDWAPWMWDIEADEWPRQLDFHTDYVSGLGVSPDGTMIAMGDLRNTVVVWDVESGEIIHTMSGGEASFKIMDVEFVPGGSLVAAASVDGTVRLWDLENPDADPLVLGKAGAAPMLSLSVSRDGEWLAAMSVNRVVSLYPLSDGESEDAAVSFLGPASGLARLVFTADGTRLVGAAGDGTLQVWDRESGQLLTVLSRHIDSANSVELLPDGRMVSASDDGTTVISTCDTCGDFDDVRTVAEARLSARDEGVTAPMVGKAPGSTT